MSSEAPKRPRSAFSRRLKEARLGDVAAQYDVAVWYANGTGTERDAAQAFLWMKSAAERQHGTAQYLLGIAYATGAGTERDLSTAIGWWQRAAEQGNDKACLRLGRFFDQAHPEIAYGWHLKAAMMGSAAAQLSVATHLAAGIGVKANPSQAHEWCRKAAVQGHAPAQFTLGRMTEDGEGTAPDAGAACNWYREAALQGHPGARLALARLKADAPSGDPSRCRKFADQGDAQDQHDLGELLERGLLGAADTQAARTWYERAANQGHLDAQVALAGLQEAAGERDQDALLLRAAVRGHAQAQFLIGTRLAAGERLMLDEDHNALAHTGDHRGAAEGDGSASDAGTRQRHPGSSAIAPEPLNALAWLARAAGQDHPSALTAVASMLLHEGEGLGRAALAAAARLGDAQAQFDIGRSLADPAAAASWYAKAAEQDHPKALDALADLLWEGKGIARDPLLARDLWLRAATLGDVQSQWRLADLLARGAEGLRPNPRGASTWLKRAARAGHAAAQARLGAIFAKGRRHEKAVPWWELAAAQADPESLFNLANACRQGRGTAQDAERAFLLMLEAAQARLTPAQAQVGLMYATGEGVAADLIEAARWFELAAQAGDAGAQANLERAIELLTPAQRKEAQRRARAFGQSAKS